MLSLASSCAKNYRPATIQKLILHALGSEAEQKRPDRDEFIKINQRRSDAASYNFQKIDIRHWEQTDLGDEVSKYSVGAFLNIKFVENREKGSMQTTGL